jgi:hypothetical protein
MDDLPTQCPAGSHVFAGRWGRCAYGYEVVLIGWWGCGASIQEVPSLVLLLASARYVCCAEFRGMLFPLSAFWIPGFEGSIGLNGRSRTLLVLVIHQQLVVSVALAMEVPGVGGAPWGIVGTEMSGASIPGRAAQLVQPQPLGARAPCARSCSDRIYPVLPTPCPRSSIKGGWRAK